jgi:rhodanese-related sulfurtransferase
MASNFTEWVANSQEDVGLLSPQAAQAAIEADPNTIVLDVRDACDLSLTGTIENTVHVSMGTLFFKADHSMPEEYRDPRLADKDRPIITTCTLGMVASIAAKTLKDYGYTNVKVLEGGNLAWGEAGLPLEEA